MSRVQKVEIQYRPGGENVRVDALSKIPVRGESSLLSKSWDAQVAAVSSTEKTIAEFLNTRSPESVSSNFYIQQQKDPEL